MPKQRNHPHHHAHGERHEDGELELPMAPFPGGSWYIIYPKGWITKPVPFVAGRSSSSRSARQERSCCWRLSSLSRVVVIELRAAHVPISSSSLPMLLSESGTARATGRAVRMHRSKKER
jgi:hypothetical protein